MDGTAVVVTGASTGIGRATALHLDSLGLRVFAGVRRDEDGEALRREASDRLTPVHLDVTKPSRSPRRRAQVGEAVQDSRLAGIVNNAGIAVAGPVEFVPLDQWRTQLEINVLGVVSMVQAFAPLLRESRGRIVTMGSLGGRLAQPMAAPYCASKHALEAISDALRLELRPWGISVSLIQPGAVKTPIWDKGLRAGAELLRNAPPEVRSLYGAAVDIATKMAIHENETGVDPIQVARADRARAAVVAATHRATRWGARPSCSSPCRASCPTGSRTSCCSASAGCRGPRTRRRARPRARRGARPRLIGWTTLAATATMAGVRQRRGTFSGVRGVPIAHREWLPDGDARGTVVIAHGINEHGGRYEHVARAAGARRVDGRRARPPRSRSLRRASRGGGALRRLDHRPGQLHPRRPHAAPRPLFLLGHSLGGLIATVYALRHQEVLDGLVLSSPSVMPPAAMSPATMRAGPLPLALGLQPAGGGAATGRREPRPGGGRRVSRRPARPSRQGARADRGRDPPRHRRGAARTSRGCASRC